MAQPPPLPSSAFAARADTRGTRAWKYLSPEDLRSLKNLLFAARVIVEGAYAGRHKSPYKGPAAEFIDYREYHPGDEIRSIDWKAYARTDRYFIKLFEKETDLNCHILVDRSGSMGYGGKPFERFFKPADFSKLEYASYLAAALIYLMIKQGDRVSLTLFDDRVNAHVPPGGTFSHLYALLDLLERQRPGRETSLAKALRDLFQLHRRRGLLILISDFLDDPIEVFNALDMYRHRRFEIILFQVMHYFEINLPPIDTIQFVDAETGEVHTARPADIAADYEKQLRQFVELVSSCALARNMDYNFVTTATPYHAVLQKYLFRRSTL